MMYRVALIGAGYIGQNHIAAFRSMEDAEITAIICRNAEHGRRVAAEVGGACGYYACRSADGREDRHRGYLHPDQSA